MSSELHSVVSNSLRPYGLYSPWNSPGQNTGVGSLSLLEGDLASPGIKPRSPTLQADSLSTESQGKSNFFLSNELLKVMIGLSLFFPNGSDITLEPFSIFL